MPPWYNTAVARHHALAPSALSAPSCCLARRPDLYHMTKATMLPFSPGPEDTWHYILEELTDKGKGGTKEERRGRKKEKKGKEVVAFIFELIANL